MATIPRSYLTTSKDNLNNIPLKNGQVISVWDSDEVYYDAPDDGTREGTPVRRKISGVRVITSLPANPMEDIVYVYIGDHGTLPDGQDLYDLRIWVNNGWYVVGSNQGDSNVKTAVSNGKFYLVGASDITDDVISSLLKNSSVYVQNGELYGDLNGNATSATSCHTSDEALIAYQAINDNASTPKPILGYLNDVASDATTDLGSTITFTKGDGTTKSVRVSDTKYNVYTASAAGLVNGTNTTVASDTSGKILSGDGWISTADITMPVADKATKDASGQTITSTYVKSAAYDTSTQNLTLTYGDDTSSSPISIPDTTYSVFSTSADGLVPKANGTGDTGKYLRGDHTWQTINQSNYTGASSGSAGVAGFVPPASAGQQEYYLKGNGYWGTTFSVGQVGLVPAPASASPDLALKADGTWGACSDTVNTTGALNDTTNLLYLVGATAQNTSTVTNTNQNVYISNNKVYSNALETVNLSDSQALTNKTYEGYTLGDACEATISTTLDSTTPNGNLPTNNAVRSYVSGEVGYLQTMIDTMVGTLLAPAFDATATYAVKDFCTYDDGTGTLLYRCHTAVTTVGDWTGNTNWIATTVIEAIKYLIQNP